jgi:hypothetical protein
MRSALSCYAISQRQTCSCLTTSAPLTASNTVPDDPTLLEILLLYENAAHKLFAQVS